MAMQLPPTTLYAGRSSVVLPPTLHRSSFLPYYSMRLLGNKKSLSKSSSSAPRFSMRVSSKQAYICRDCGYIYNDRTPFDKLPDNYFCPVCAAPKRRFRPYMPDVSKNVNDKDVRKARKAELQRDEAVGKALPIAIAVGVLALAALYFYVNNTS
ncbi:Rubredoxin-like domain [Arabidopsis thaliana x Arabidopsis arenosa]|uniref:Rubredoxin-like domain n=1 Tax=Arabidopsis thaliana x Arabidopsis arenosa TaxID=1240361 RepID=A0A8T1XGT8_9BRAS|nr:Rubredoxin-like domain [Arabidopsis thaliana x Arabidopsis arenosa]